MTYIKYQHFNLRLKSEALIERINWIIDEYGPESWELDALRPKYIQNLISNAIEPCISDKELWQKTLDEEAEARKPLALLHERWEGC